jgi:imidazolonepropionase-like amidohydrolase
MRFYGTRSRLCPALLSALAIILLAAPVAAQQRGTVAFVGVNVIPMDRERVLQNHTVVVQDGRITAVGPAASTQVPSGATRVDGSGKYLIPGIAEMHGHVPAVGQAGPQFAEDVLFLYIAGGATTVRGMQGHISQIELRRRVESGELVGPRLVLSGPAMAGIGGNAITDPAVAEQRVREYKQQGFDLLKVHEGLSQEVYDAIARSAKSQNMQWGGHVSDIVGLRAAIAAQQTTVDHLDNFEIELLRDPQAGITPQNVDESRLPALVRETRAAGVAVVPTMALWEVIVGAHESAPLAALPEMKYMPPQTVQNWVTQTNTSRQNANPANAAFHVGLRNRILKALSDGGVVVLMGTDAPQRFSVPGFSLERELDVMAAAGMSPFAILQSGTTAVASHFGWSDTGTIATGKRADLILLDANPLTSIANMRRRAGVMANGRWLSKADIDARLGAIAARYAGS